MHLFEESNKGQIRSVIERLLKENHFKKNETIRNVLSHYLKNYDEYNKLSKERNEASKLVFCRESHNFDDS